MRLSYNKTNSYNLLIFLIDHFKVASDFYFKVIIDHIKIISDHFDIISDNINVHRKNLIKYNLSNYLALPNLLCGIIKLTHAQVRNILLRGLTISPSLIYIYIYISIYIYYICRTNLLIVIKNKYFI